MPTMTATNAALGAGATESPLAGKLYEFVPPPGAGISVAINGSAVGLTGTVTIGGRTILDNEPCGLANRFPIVPDDYIVAGEPGLGGERVIIRVTNPTGGALGYWVRCDIEPV